ncbi:transient receptor potential cation channel subfamily V member 5-like [Watersipora subatra]|uniref:transient receptor potential cation channel subfamily V member 5-like n=1 Tax=Watersipora subatra TaxID=2589382 RepID=UPI00355C2109
MDNTESQVSSADRNQADAKACEWYQFLALTGDGTFVDIMKECLSEKDYTKIDDAIRENIGKYLYNNGEGKMVPCSEIVHVRKCFRNDTIPQPPSPTSENGSQPKFGQNSQKVGPAHDVEANGHANGNQKTQENGVLKNPASSTEKQPMRLVCWDLYKRGTVGETILHLCLLLTKPLFITLAKRLLYVFPKLFVDIYVSDKYFGENILHMAIVNEDPAMVKYLLDSDKDGLTIGERAYGTFFSCTDQESSRKDQDGTELMKMSSKTNYQGYLYWGEYPLSFAACLKQEECLRLLFSTMKRSEKSARIDPYAQDHNGNTVLHMLVIHNKLDIFDVVLSMAGPKLLSIKNNKGLTPLTLAAAMAHKEIYNHLIEKEREVYWVYGDVTCAAYPLDNIDTIGPKGEINPTSALHLIIHGEKPDHLKMVDGMIVNLLNEKWSTFLRFKFYRRLTLFSIYFLIFMIALVLRPGKDVYDGESKYEQNENGTFVATNQTWPPHFCYLNGPPKGIEYEASDYARLSMEGITLLGVIIYLISAAINLKQTGRQRFLETLWSAPSLTLFYISCILVLLMVPSRIFCSFSKHLATYEDVLTIITILMTAPHFLFFCRGFKMVGPFVTMIYKMLVGDLLRFFTIYFIFLIGFSQSMYVIHVNYNHPENKTTPFTNPPEALMGMFYMSMGEFITMYEDLKYTTHEIMGKVVFVFYMILVTLLLINMLIAMMGNTYTLVNETQKEWLRQWAHIVLAIEQTVSPKERENQQHKYSQPMKNGDDAHRALAIRWHQTEEEREKLMKGKEEIKQKQRDIMMRKAAKSGADPGAISQLAVPQGSAKGAHSIS